MATTYILNEALPEALVIHCSDPRFQQAFRKFIGEELRIEHYVPLIVPGSVSPISLQDLQPKYFKALFQQLKLLTMYNRVPRVVIINHDDCRGYESIKGFILARRVGLTEQQRKDLLAGAALLQEFLPGAHVELYQATLKPDKQIGFERIF